MPLTARAALHLILVTALFLGTALSAQALPTIAQLSRQPQPQIKLFEFTPVVQDFGPRQLTLKSGTLILDVQRVTYTAQGVQIDGEAEQIYSSTGIVTLNHMHKGTLGDAGTIYRLRDPGDKLSTRAAKKEIGGRFAL